MAEDNIDSQTFDKNINPVTGKPFAIPNPESNNIANLDSYLGIDRGPTIGHNGKPVSKELQEAIKPNSHFSLDTAGVLSQINPITGRPYDNTKTYRVYDCVNRGHFSGTKEIENLHSQKDSTLTASALMNMGLTPTTENDWEDMRAQKQGVGTKALYGTARMLVTAGTTLSETLFGSATGAANFALAGKNASTKRAIDSYISGKTKSIEEVEFEEGQTGLEAIFSVLGGRTTGPGYVRTGYGDNTDADGDGIVDNASMVKVTDNEQELENQLRAALENDTALLSSLRSEGLTIDDAITAIKQEKYEKGYLDRWGDDVASWFGGKVGYDAPGGLGAVDKLNRYKAAVQKSVETKNGPGAWNDIAAAYWDTPLGNAMDFLRDAANESLPIYYTRKEQESDEINFIPFEEGSANFYFDKVFNGIGFAAGAFAPMYLTKGKGGAATVYRGARNLFTRGVKAERVAAGLTEAAAAEEATVASGGAAASRVEQQLQTAQRGTKKIQDAAKLLVSSYAASYSEAAVESRDVKKQYIEARVAEWMAANPGKSKLLIPPDEMAEIERYANAAGNTNFAMQMPILIGTNMFTLSMLMGGSLLSKFRLPPMVSNLGSKLGIGAEETVKAGKIVGAAGSATEATWFTSKAGKIAEQAIKKGAPLAKGAAFEGGQELAQYFSQQFNLSYWHARQTDDVASVSEHMAESFKKTFTDKEGLEQGLIGAMIGGGMSALATRGQNKAQKQATEKLLAIRNSGVLSNIIQRAEMSSETQAIMEDYHKESSKGNHTKASELLSKALAHEARIAEEFGGGELYQEMLNDMEKMTPEDFTKYALPQLGEEAAKNFTQEDVKNTVKEIKEGLNRNMQIAKNVKEMFPTKQKSSPIERLMMSEEQRNNEDLQIRVNEAYKNMLYHAAVEMKDHDVKINSLIDKVNQKLQDNGMPLLDPNNLRFSIKNGSVEVGQDGKVNIESILDTLGYSRSSQDMESQRLFLRGLDPQDREEVQNAFDDMYTTAARREQAVQAYEELRKNPDKRTLYYEALQADQTENTKVRRNKIADMLIKNAKTADELINSLPNVTDEELKQKALARIKQLRTKQSKIRKDKFSDMSVEEMRKLDYDSLSKIEQAAYNEALRFKKNSEVRDAIKNKVDAILDKSDDSTYYEIAALFKAMNREKAGDQIIPAIARQMEQMLEQSLLEPVNVIGMAVYYDKVTKRLQLIVEYELQSDPSKRGRIAESVENIVGLDKFESRLKEVMANDISAKKTTEALTPEDETDDLGQRILEEEQRNADPTVTQAKNLVTNVDTEIVEVNGIRTHIPTGRGFLIGGRRYENTGITIMDAINFSPDGQVSSITLFDVDKQEYYTFRKRRGQDEVEVIDAIYEVLLTAAECRAYFSQAPTMTEEETQEVQQDREDTIKTVTDDIITPDFGLPLEALSTETLKQQQVRLTSAIRTLNAVLDSYYADYYALGYTNAEANKDENVKKLRGLIASMQKMHNNRRAALIDREQKVQLSVGAFQDEIAKLSKEIDDLSEANAKLEKDIADNQEMLDSGIIATNTAEGVQQLAQLQQEIAAAKQIVAYNEKKIQNKTNQLNSHQNEIDILMGRRKVSAEGTQEAAAGQIAEEQGQRTGETSEDTGLDEVGNEPGEIEARLQAEKEAAEQMSSQTESDQAGGQVNVSGTVELQFSPQHTTDSTAAPMSVQLDIQLTKGEFTTNDNWKVLAEVDENGITVGRPNDLTTRSRIVVNSKGEEIGRINVDRKALGNPNIAKPGTQVIFEVREDTQWWQEEGKASLPEDRHWEQVPIFVKIIEEKPNSAGEMVKVETYVGLLTGYKQDANDGFKGNTRKIIYETVKNGGTATSTIKSKRLSTGKGGNIINLRTADTKDATGNIIPGKVVFVNPASEGGLGRRFVKGVPTSATPIVAIAVGVETKDAQGNVTDISRRWELGNTQGLLPDELAKISYALDQAMTNYDTLTDAGVVAFLVQDPNGNYRVVQGSTRFLTQEAQDSAIAALKNRDVNTFNQIVGTNKIKASAPGYMYVEEVSKNWGATEGKNGIRVTFWSPAAKSLVSVQYDKLLTAIEQYKASGKAELAFSFTVVEQTEEGGKDFKSASREKAEFDVLKNVMVKEFLDQLAQKRFQVSKALLETNAEYTSPTNPERTYSSYTDYLFSETEAQEERKEGLGSKAILSSDVANNGYGSVFFDIGLEFGTIESNGVQMEVKEEMRAQAFDQPTNTPAPAANTVTADINLELPALPGMPGAPTVTPTDDFVPLVVPMDDDVAPATQPQPTSNRAEVLRRRFEDRNSPVRGSVIYRLQNKIAGIENPGPGTEVTNLSEAIILAGDKLSAPIKIREGEVTNVVFDQGESSFRFTYKGQKFAAFYVANARGQLRWEIAKFNEKSGTYQSISLDELKNINEKYGSQKDLLLSLGVKDLIEDIENFEKVEYSKEDKSSGNGIIPLENTVSAEQIRLGKKYGQTYTLEDFLKEYDAELAAKENKPTATAPAVTPATQPAPAATTANSAITTVKVTTKDNVMLYESLRNSSELRDNEKVSELTRAAESQAREELMKEAKQTMRGRLLGVSEPTTQAIRERAIKIAEKMIASAVAPSNTGEIMFNIHDVLGGWSRKHGNTNEHANYDNRYSWQSDFSPYSYVGFTKSGHRALVVVMPNTDTSNVTRPGTATSISILLPNNVSSAYLASSIISKAKEVAAQAKLSGSTVTSKILMDSILPVIKEGFTGVKQQTKPSAIPAAVEEAFRLQQEQKREEEKNKKQEEVVEVDQWKTHTVKKGETLKSIAAKYKTTVAEIKQWNNLKSNFLPAYKNLKIKFKVKKTVQNPISKPASPSTTASEGMTLAELEKFLEDNPGTEITPEIEQQISDETSANLMDEYGEDSVSLQDDMIEILGLPYPKSEINAKFLIGLGLSPQEANEILKNIC